MSSPLFNALSSLSGDELYVIASIYWGELTETQIAVELTELRGEPYSRNQVHRRRLTAEGKIRRSLISPQSAEERNVLVAQRSNLARGEGAHRSWANVLMLMLAVLVGFGVVVSAATGDSLIAYLAIVAFPSVAGVIELWELAALHRRASDEKSAKRKEVDQLLVAGAVRARELQDDVFRARLNHPHVPNWFHSLRREEDDLAMRSAARDLMFP